MSATELQELDEVKGLIARGQQLGVLTYAEIATAMAELDLDETEVDEHGTRRSPTSVPARWCVVLGARSSRWRATTGAWSLKTFPVEVRDGAIWLVAWATVSPRRRRVQPEVQDHLDGPLGSVPERAQRKAWSDLAVSQLLGFAEVL
jgi:Sigma-70 factor, region 1.1